MEFPDKDADASLCNEHDQAHVDTKIGLDQVNRAQTKSPTIIVKPIGTLDKMPPKPIGPPPQPKDTKLGASQKKMTQGLSSQPANVELNSQVGDLDRDDSTGLSNTKNAHVISTSPRQDLKLVGEPNVLLEKKQDAHSIKVDQDKVTCSNEQLSDRNNEPADNADIMIDKDQVKDAQNLPETGGKDENDLNGIMAIETVPASSNEFQNCENDIETGHKRTSNRGVHHVIAAADDSKATAPREKSDEHMSASKMDKSGANQDIEAKKHSLPRHQNNGTSIDGGKGEGSNQNRPLEDTLISAPGEKLNLYGRTHITRKQEEPRTSGGSVNAQTQPGPNKVSNTSTISLPTRSSRKDNSSTEHANSENTPMESSGSKLGRSHSDDIPVEGKTITDQLKIEDPPGVAQRTMTGMNTHPSTIMQGSQSRNHGQNGPQNRGDGENSKRLREHDLSVETPKGGTKNIQGTVLSPPPLVYPSAPRKHFTMGPREQWKKIDSSPISASDHDAGYTSLKYSPTVFSELGFFSGQPESPSYGLSTSRSVPKDALLRRGFIQMEENSEANIVKFCIVPNGFINRTGFEISPSSQVQAILASLELQSPEAIFATPPNDALTPFLSLRKQMPSLIAIWNCLTRDSNSWFSRVSNIVQRLRDKNPDLDLHQVDKTKLLACIRKISKDNSAMEDTLLDGVGWNGIGSMICAMRFISSCEGILEEREVDWNPLLEHDALTLLRVSLHYAQRRLYALDQSWFKPYFEKVKAASAAYDAMIEDREQGRLEEFLERRVRHLNQKKKASQARMRAIQELKDEPKGWEKDRSKFKDIAKNKFKIAKAIASHNIQEQREQFRGFGENLFQKIHDDEFERLFAKKENFLFTDAENTEWQGLLNIMRQDRPPAEDVVQVIEHAVGLFGKRGLLNVEGLLDKSGSRVSMFFYQFNEVCGLLEQMEACQAEKERRKGRLSGMIYGASSAFIQQNAFIEVAGSVFRDNGLGAFICNSCKKGSTLIGSTVLGFNDIKHEEDEWSVWRQKADALVSGIVNNSIEFDHDAEKLKEAHNEEKQDIPGLVIDVDKFRTNTSPGIFHQKRVPTTCTREDAKVILDATSGELSSHWCDRFIPLKKITHILFFETETEQSAFNREIRAYSSVGVLMIGGARIAWDMALEAIRQNNTLFVFNGSGGASDALATIVDYMRKHKTSDGKVPGWSKELHNKIKYELAKLRTAEACEELDEVRREALGFAFNLPTAVISGCVECIQIETTSVPEVEERVTSAMAKFVSIDPTELGAIGANRKRLLYAWKQRSVLISNQHLYFAFFQLLRLLISLQSVLTTYFSSKMMELGIEESCEPVTEDAIVLKERQELRFWLVALPVLTSFLYAMQQFLNPHATWKALVVAQNQILMHIYLFRAGAGPYSAGIEHKKVAASDGEEEHSKPAAMLKPRERFALNLQECMKEVSAYTMLRSKREITVISFLQNENSRLLKAYIAKVSGRKSESKISILSNQASGFYRKLTSLPRRVFSRNRNTNIYQIHPQELFGKMLSNDPERVLKKFRESPHEVVNKVHELGMGSLKNTDDINQEEDVNRSDSMDERKTILETLTADILSECDPLHFSLSLELYLNTRFEEITNDIAHKVKIYHHTVLIFQATILVFISGATLLAYLGEDFWVPTVVAISGVLATYKEADQMSERLARVNKIQIELAQLKTWWFGLNLFQARLRTNIVRFIEEAERLSITQYTLESFDSGGASQGGEADPEAMSPE